MSDHPPASTGADDTSDLLETAPPARRILGPAGDVWHAVGSLRLTIVLLAVSVALIFFGTLDQVQFGIRQVQAKYFESLLVVWSYPPSWIGGQGLLGILRIPLPGGYLVGPLLVINLLAAHFRYFRLSWRKCGIAMLHAGVVLLLLSQGFTQWVQEEYYLWMKEGGSGQYLESFTEDELVFLDTTSHPDPTRDRVVSIPVEVLHSRAAYRHPALPFTIMPREFFPNAAIRRRDGRPGAPPALADRGLGAQFDLGVELLPRVTQHNERDVTTAVVELTTPEGSLGRWLLSNVFDDRFPVQRFEYDGRTWEVALRIRREYLPFRLELLEFIHERYPGTQIPRHFASRILLHDPQHAEPIATTIQMNEPLRHGGLTFYQASFTPDDTASMLQVVRNPGWTGPYIACALITLGMLVQFGIGLGRFLSRRSRTAEAAASGPNPSPSST